MSFSKSVPVFDDESTKRIYEIASNINIHNLADFAANNLNYRWSIPVGSTWNPNQSFFMLEGEIKVRDIVGAAEVPGDWRTQQGVRVASSTVEEGKEEYKSYLDFDTIVTPITANNPTGEQKVAIYPGFNAPSTIFSNMQLRLNQKEILSVPSNFSDIDTMAKRHIDRQQRESLYGDYLNGSAWKRFAQVSTIPVGGDKDSGTAGIRSLMPMSYDEESMKESGSFQIIWSPSFGIFALDKMCAGDYQLSFDTNRLDIIKSSFLESLHDMPANFWRDQVKFDITNFKFFVVTEKSEKLINDSIYIPITDIDLQHKQIQANDSEVSSYFDVRRNAVMFTTTVASVKNRAGTNSFYPRTSYITVDSSKSNAQRVPLQNDVHLNDVYIQYCAQRYPSIPFNIKHDDQGDPLLSRLYFENCLMSGDLDKDLICESYGQFYETGPKYDVRIQIDRENFEDRLEVLTKIGKAEYVVKDQDGKEVKVLAEIGSMQCLLFQYLRKVIKVTFDAAGRVADVSVVGK